MISFRRAALLGLDAPLSAIMLAVLGLWPRADDDLPPAPQFIGGPDAPAGRSSVARDHEEDQLDRVIEKIRLKEQSRRSMAIMLAMVAAIAECV